MGGPPPQGAPDSLVDPQALAARPSFLLQEGDHRDLLVLPAVHGEVVTQDDGALPLDDHGRVPAHRAQPPAELARVVDGGREADESHLGRGQDQHLLPHAAAVGVLDEVHLVENDRVEAL